jgi:uncharacterized protein
MNPLFKDWGVGVGLRSTHRSQFLQNIPKSVSWAEVISENYLPMDKRGFGKAFQELSQIRESLPIALHGVSLNIGSADKLDFVYLNRLKQLIDAISPLVVSDHLSWTGVDGENLHDLLPIPYTEDTLAHVADKIGQVQDFLGRRLLIENPTTYLELKSSTMTESEFVVRLLERADCGLLLDINNVYVNSVNHGFDPIEYLEKIPSERIGQIHLAGHSQQNGYLIDTHDAPVADEVWALLKWITTKKGKFTTMLERDGNIPEWSELEKEILKIGEIRNELK